LQSTTESVRNRRAEACAQRAALRRRLEGGTSEKRSGLTRLLRVLPGLAQNASQEECFVTYSQVRLAEIALECALNLLGTVTRQVQDFLQECTLCQQKLGQLAALLEQYFTILLGTEAQPDTLPNRTLLLPGRTTDLAQAAECLFRNMKPEQLAQLEDAVGKEVLGPQGDFWQYLVQSKDQFGNLGEELFCRAWPIALKALAGIDAAGLFLQAQPDQGRAEKELLAHLYAAAPKLAAAESWQRLVMALPAGAAGETVKDLVAKALPDMPITHLSSEGDVVLVKEGANIPLRQVVAELCDRDPGYLETSQRVLTRTDIDWAPLEDSDDEGDRVTAVRNS
jgi:hypothetical protein